MLLKRDWQLRVSDKDDTSEGCVASEAGDSNIRESWLSRQQVFRPTDALLSPCVETMTSYSVNKDNWSQKLAISVFGLALLALTLPP